MGLQIFLQYSAFSYFGYILRSRTAEFYGNSVLNFLSALHTVFHSSYIISHSNQQCTEVSVSPKSCLLATLCGGAGGGGVYVLVVAIHCGFDLDFSNGY